jgi:hypothetical protein
VETAMMKRKCGYLKTEEADIATERKNMKTIYLPGGGSGNFVRRGHYMTQV